MYPQIKKGILSDRSDFLISALAARQEGINVGSPCIIDIGRARSLSDRNANDPLPLIMDIFKNGKNISEAINRMVSEVSIAAPIINLFPDKSDMPLIQTEVSYCNNYYYIDTPPLLLDTYKSESFDDIDEIMPLNRIHELPSKISTMLNKYRYVNYVISNICKSNSEIIQDYIYHMVSEFLKKHTVGICILFKGAENKCVLIDTLSISFYQLQDVIPIFDKRHMDGVVIELLLTNSTLIYDDIIKDQNNYTLIRMLFSMYRDNILTVDGEKLARPCQCPINDVIITKINKILIKHTPDDTAFRKLGRIEEA